MLRVKPLFLLTSLLAFATSAEAVTIIGAEFLDVDTVRFIAPASELEYYLLTESTDLLNFTGIDISLGNEDVIWDVDFGELPRAFYLVRGVSIFTPADTDGDLIDDFFELNDPLLDPLDGSDADDDPDGNGLSFLQEYLREIFETDAPQWYSREVTTFNFGAPAESAISREVTTFNLGAASAPIEASSREVSVFNGSGPLPFAQIPQSYSREISVFNLGSSSAAVEAISREVTIFNGSGPQPFGAIPQSYSREVAVFNFASPSSPVEAISREITVLRVVVGE